MTELKEYRVYLWANQRVFIDVWATSGHAACQIVDLTVREGNQGPAVLGAVPKLWQVTEVES